jgi:hypothetical protein
MSAAACHSGCTRRPREEHPAGFSFAAPGASHSGREARGNSTPASPRLGRVDHWTQHDLRRSVATHIAEIGVAPHIVEAVRNHVSGHKAGIAGVYNRVTYEKEKRAALAMWADHVMAAVEGRSATVVPLRA